MQKGQIDRQWRTLARSGTRWGVIGTIKCKKVKLIGSGAHWRAVARAGVIGTIKCKKVKLIGTGTQWRALVHSGKRWGDWDN